MSSPLNVTTPGAPNSAPGAVAPSNEGGNGHSPSSVLGQLKLRAQAQQAEHTQEFPVLGEFGETLKIKYKVLDKGPMDRFVAARANMGDKPEMTNLAMTFMAQSCICLTGYAETGQSWVLEDEQGVVRLEHRLLELLEMVPPNPNPEVPLMLDAHDVIFLLFGGNALAIVSHSDDLMTWMQDPAKKPDLGKSSGATGPMFSPSALSAASAQGT